VKGEREAGGKSLLRFESSVWGEKVRVLLSVEGAGRKSSSTLKSVQVLEEDMDGEYFGGFYDEIPAKRAKVSGLSGGREFARGFVKVIKEEKYAHTANQAAGLVKSVKRAIGSQSKAFGGQP